MKYDFNRSEEMYTISDRVQDMLRMSTNDYDLTITYVRIDESYHRLMFTPWQWERLNLRDDEEYFIIYRTAPDTGKAEYLYAINVTGDSYLTAAAELTRKVADKF